ncbi:MAG: hypothetical protein ABI780_06035 [Ardenticatenales bacterium]
MSDGSPPPSVRARPRSPFERRFGAAPFGPLAGGNALWAAFGIAAALALFLAILRAPHVPSPGRTAAAPERPPATPVARWQPLADHLTAAAIDGDTLIVALPAAGGAPSAGDTLGADDVAALAAAIAADHGGPRLAAAIALPDTAAAAANRMAAPLAAGRVWAVWPVAWRVDAATPAASLEVPIDDPLRAWLDANGRAVARARVEGSSLDADGDGVGAWALGAWEHVPSLDGGDYPPLVVPETLGALELVGWTITPLPLRVGRGARILAAWRVGRDGAPDYRIDFTLLGPHGTPAAALADPSAGAALPVSEWPAADIAVVPHDLRVPADLTPGAYDLAVNAVDPVTGEAVAPGAGRVIGAVNVVAP